MALDQSIQPDPPFTIDERIDALTTCSDDTFDGVVRHVREVYASDGIHFQHTTDTPGEWVTFERHPF